MAMVKIMTDTINRFDIVAVLDQSSIRYLSSPPGSKPTPIGNWSVIGNIGNTILCTQEQCLILIPSEHVILVAKYNSQSIFNKLGKLSDE